LRQIRQVNVISRPTCGQGVLTVARSKKKRKTKEKRGKRKKEREKKKKGIIVISFSYPSYTVRRSCFAKHFPKMDSALSRRIHSSSIARAGTATAGAGAGACQTHPYTCVSHVHLPSLTKEYALVSTFKRSMAETPAQERINGIEPSTITLRL
jgi:hypothetical protein